MENESIIRQLDKIGYLEERRNDIHHKILSVQMSDLTICTEDKVLTPEEQAKLLYQEWQSLNEALNIAEASLKAAPQEDLMQVYVSLMGSENSSLKNTRLNNLASLLGRSKNKGMER